MLDDVKELDENLGELGDALARLATLRGHAAVHIARLREILRSPEGVPSLEAENALAELPELCEVAANRLAEQVKTEGTRRTHEEHVAAARGELSDAEAQVADHQQELIAWEGEWRKLLVQAKLPAELPADRDTVSALADLDRLAQVAAWVTAAAKNERESERSTATIAQFHALLSATAVACGLAVLDDETELHQLVGRLYKDAKANRSAKDRRDGLLVEQDKLVATGRDLEQTVQAMRAELAALCEQSGVDDAETLGEAVRRSETRTALVMSLTEVNRTLPPDVETLMEEVAGTDHDLLHAELLDLDDRVADLDGRRAAQSELSGKRKTELALLDGSDKAAQAAAQMETTAATLLEESEEYLRLQVARSIVMASVEEYRQSQQDPVLHQAGLLFERLTLRGFSGLELDQEAEAPVVLARRGGNLMTVDQLSEGTRDQLYLALRLASMERYTEEQRALPFIVDDIFITFHDQRTRATLKVLDEMADQFQMIVFTHHDHLTKLAQAELPPDRAHIHRLARFVPTDDAVELR